jgi:NAD(P)-dependent dehydrogenase (short-subunit alcohol dehydrogenase family)
VRDDPNVRFDGRVAVVTGAARGLGRAYAAALAERGAAVVVNDLQGSAGTGDSPSAADEVAATIRSSGGLAVSSNHDVTVPEAAEAIVQTAIDSFGRVDIVINNAGVSHVAPLDASLDAFRQVVEVNLFGAVHVTRAAWPHLLRQRYGRIVMATSAVGLWGAPESAAYAASKAAVAGLARSLAEEGRGHGVQVNSIAPAAETRLTEARFSRPGSRRWRPEVVSPAVLYLAHESCDLSGEVISAYAGLFARVQITQGPGHLFDARREIDVDDFVGALDAVTSMDGARSFENGHIDALRVPLEVDLHANNVTPS